MIINKIDNYYVIKLPNSKIDIYNQNNLGELTKSIIHKISIHTDSIFLYKIDYFDINKENIKSKNTYYYKNNFFMEIDDDIDTFDYIKLLELSEVIFDDILDIMDKGIKI